MSSTDLVSNVHLLLDRLSNALPARTIHFKDVAWRYFKASHQNDPIRTILELLLLFFVLRTWTQSRTRSEASGRNFVKLSEKEIDELVNEWHPESLIPKLTPDEAKYNPPVLVGTPSLRSKVLIPGKDNTEVEKSVINLASTNFSGLAGNERIKDKAIECVKGYGVGSCGPPGFYGTMDVHLTLERSLAEFLGTEAAILYAQAFSTVSSVIPAFAKRGDIIVADRGVNFAIQKGIQISRCDVRWFEHNDMEDLERVLKQVQEEYRKKRKPLTRRFIVAEGLYELDGQVTDLPAIIELKHKYKFRLILDETWSFGVLGDTGRGITELFDIPGHEIDAIIGSMAIGLCSAGGFCAGSIEIVHHQRINSPAYVFSASLPPLLAVSANEALYHLACPLEPSSNLPLQPLPDNVLSIRTVLDKIASIEIPSDPLSPLIHILVAPSTNGLTPSRAEQEKLLQDVVDEALQNGVLVTRVARVWEQEMIEARPSIRLCVSAGLTKKECDKAATTLKNALVKVLGKKR